MVYAATSMKMHPQKEPVPTEKWVNLRALFGLDRGFLTFEAELGMATTSGAPVSLGKVVQTIGKHLGSSGLTDPLIGAARSKSGEIEAFFRGEIEKLTI